MSILRIEDHRCHRCMSNHSVLHAAKMSQLASSQAVRQLMCRKGPRCMPFVEDEYIAMSKP